MEMVAPFISAPNSPGSRHSSIPFNWEEKPGTPKSPSFDQDFFDFDFSFSFSFSGTQIEKPASFAAADELFDSGKIKPLKPPPRLCSPVIKEQGKKSPRSGGFLSPLRRGRNQRGKDLDPFVLAMVEATRSRRGSRSLSPFGRRCKEGGFIPPAAAAVVEKGGRGWKTRIKELFLFRSASEGGEGKRNDFLNSGSSSSSSSASSNSSKRTIFMECEEKKVAASKQRAFVIRGFNAGVSFDRRRG